MEHDPVDFGAVLKVVGIGFQDDLFRKFQFFEDVGAGPYGSRIETTSHDVLLPLEDMAWDDPLK